MALTKQARSMRIIDLKDGQRSEFMLADGRRVVWTVRKFRGRARWRIEIEEYPAGMRILTKSPPVR